MRKRVIDALELREKENERRVRGYVRYGSNEMKRREWMFAKI